jgi:hypothetical protein
MPQATTDCDAKYTNAVNGPSTPFIDAMEGKMGCCCCLKKKIAETGKGGHQNDFLKILKLVLLQKKKATVASTRTRISVDVLVSCIYTRARTLLSSYALTVQVMGVDPNVDDHTSTYCSNCTLNIDGASEMQLHNMQRRS